MINQNKCRNWQRCVEWNGAEAPRLLFESLASVKVAKLDCLGDLLTYQGISLPRLFEGEWITLLWPNWFSSISNLNERMASQNKLNFIKSSDAVQYRAGKSVLKRHSKSSILLHNPLITKDNITNHFRESRCFPYVSLMRILFDWMQTCQHTGKCETLDLAFFPFSYKIAPYIMPVAIDAAKFTSLRIGIVGWETHAPIDIPINFTWKSLYENQKFDTIVDAWKASNNIIAKYNAFEKEGGLNYFKEWCGWDLRPLVRPFLRRFVNQSFVIIRSILLCRDWFKDRQIKGVIVPQDGGAFIRSIIAGAKLAGAKTFSIQYGYVCDTPEISEPFEDLAFLHGNFSKRLFLNRGSSLEKISVAGTTAYDNIILMRSQRMGIREILGTKYNFRRERHWIVVATWHVQAVYPMAQKASELALICGALKNINDIEVVFKLHPSDTEDGLLEKATADKFAIKAHIIKDVSDNESLICAADLLVCNFTTLVILAVVAKTPTLIVDLSADSESKKQSFVNEGVTEFAEHVKDAEDVIKTIIENGRDDYWEKRQSKRESFITDRIYAEDASSSSRILDVILKDI